MSGEKPVLVEDPPQVFVEYVSIYVKIPGKSLARYAVSQKVVEVVPQHLYFLDAS